MPCPEGNTNYKIQSGDTLYRIASKFNTTVSEILSVNGEINPNILYIGQEICIPVKQPTLQIADLPILINGININTKIYPAINYKPAGAEYPYIYVPIAEFSKVGANVIWDEANMVLKVSTDYYTNRNIISQQQSTINELLDQIELLKSYPPGFQLNVTSIEGVTPEQKAEIYNLVDSKTSSELVTMWSTAYSEAESTAVSKGGIFSFGTGLLPDGRGAAISFSGLGPLSRYDVRVRTNDPNFEENYDRYTNEQKEIFYKFVNATFYVVTTDLTKELQMLP